MKFGIKLVLFATVIGVLSGCSTPVQPMGTSTFTPSNAETTSVDLIDTPSITETIPPTNSVTWETGIREIFEIQCAECHLSTPTGGFSITSYTRVLQGSNLGPVIIPGNPDESHLFYKLKFGGNHPGYMSKEQTDLVWQWVSSGAPE